MWQGNWDPEGIFSTVPAIVTGIAGMLTGKFLLTDIPIERKIIWMFIAGIGACILGYVWSWNFPLNKNLWTSSYVLVTGGLACMAFAVFIYLIDVLQFKSVGWPGIVYGANAIIIYVVADLLSIFFVRFLSVVILSITISCILPLMPD
jgi:predicted acyltransferase